MPRQYPQLEVHLGRLRQNTREITSRCRAFGIDVCGTIKGCNGLPPVARALLDGGVTELASSRIEQIMRCRQAGVPGPYLLLRIPGRSELPDLVRWCDRSLQSEEFTLRALEAECARQGKEHSVILMTDLGDLREGCWDEEELVRLAVVTERELPHVHLRGIGVNLGCYGSIEPTPDKMQELLRRARAVEAAIGRPLEVISGGATTSFLLVHRGTMPAGINHLRIGDNILLSKGLQIDWGIKDMDYLRMDTFILRSEVLEVKMKPTYPRGKIALDAFGHCPTYVDRGIRRRALLGFGRADVGSVEELLPRTPGLQIIGASSDHCIVDVEDCGEIRVGDVLDFSLSYENLLYLSGLQDTAITYIDD